MSGVLEDSSVSEKNDAFEMQVQLRIRHEEAVDGK